jgi:cell division septation protein DedD
MKSAPIPDYNSTIDEPNERWSLSWKPDGYCDKFTRESILACAPSASGVYGLFNFDCQIFIGESANIREVLLRLERQADFASEFLRPTGFTFELCPEEARKQKASELIARYRPALQTMAASNQLEVPANGSLTGTGKTRSASETPAEHHELPSQSETAQQAHRFFKFKRAHYAALAILLSASAMAYYFFTPIDNAQSLKSGVDEKSLAHAPSPQVSAFRQNGGGSKRKDMSSSKPARERAKLDDAEIPGKANGTVRFAKASSADDSDIQKLVTAVKASLGSDAGEKKWSVQISASPARDIADRLSEELIANGYNSYVVPAEVKGQTYYRVRAGRLDTREEAESMRQSLIQRERFRDAYVTRD